MADTKKVAVYCRLANEDNQRIKSQIERVTEYAREQGYTDVIVYADNGVNGITLNRPGFSQMEADMNLGKIGKVFVLSIDRISRNSYLAHLWIRKTQGKDIKIIDVHKTINDESLKISDAIMWFINRSICSKDGGFSGS